MLLSLILNEYGDCQYFTNSIMSTTRSRASTSTASSLMQDVPGAFPMHNAVEDEEESAEQSGYATLSQGVHARRAEYVRPKHVRIKIGTWNLAASKGTEKDIGSWFIEGKGVTEALAGLSVNNQDDVHRDNVDGSRAHQREDVAAQEARYEHKQNTLPKGDPGSLPGGGDIGLYVLGLQEVVDIASAMENLRPYTDPSAAKTWKESVESALPAGYQLIAEQQLIGLLLLIYASSELAPDIRAVSTTSVGTGLMGYMGNKGAVTARIVLGDTTRLVFINSHLAAGADKAALERRNWDASQIVQRTRFEPIQDAMDLQQSAGEQIGDEDFAFWIGDLNYRLEGVPGDDLRRLLMLHTRNEYDLSQRSARKIDREIQEATESARKRTDARVSVSSDSSSYAPSFRSSFEEPPASSASTSATTLMDEISASDDPTSLQTTINSLLPHDELQQQMKARKSFQDGWREGEIKFLPTYKYDIGSVGVFDSSEKKRAPSWCDRILYRAKRDKLRYDTKIKEEEDAKKKDEEMKASGTDQAANDDDILYDYDPETDGTNANDDYDEYDENDDTGRGVVKESLEDEIQLEYYTAHQRVLSSDHKPLDAIFTLKYDAVVPELKAKVHAEVAKELDKAENEGRPNVTIVLDQHRDEEAQQLNNGGETTEGVSFGDVRWAQAKHRSLTIANTSRVPATINLIERPPEPDQASGIAPSWLNLRLDGVGLASSSTSTTPVAIEAGETASLELEIRIIDMGLVHTLNERRKALEDILVLRVENGRDHFIPVRANWLETSLASSINKLVRIPEGGIRMLQHQRPDDSGKHRTRSESDANSETANESTADEPVRFSAPRELFRLTAAIEGLSTRVIAEWDMIAPDESTDAAPWVKHHGWPFDEQAWSERDTPEFATAIGEACNALDEDTSLEASLPPEMPRAQQLHVLSSLLLLFLTSMSVGVVTPELWTKIEAHLLETEKSKRKPSIEEQRTAIQELLATSPSHNISFILITSMLDRILQEVCGASRSKDEPPLSPTSKVGGTLRRVTGAFGKSADTSHREQAIAAWSRIFGDAMVRVSTASGKKPSSAQERRKRELLELFLRRDDPG